MHLNTFLFHHIFLFWPSPHSLSFPLSPFPPTRPSPTGLSFFSLPYVAQPAKSPSSQPNRRPSPLPSLSRCQAGPACRARPQARVRLELTPESGCGTSFARVAPWARTSRPLSHPIKPPPCALGPINPTAAASPRKP
jgi:hypothetical protein